MWWETTDTGQRPIKKEPVKCPVCKKVLEYRYPDTKIIAYCKECRAEFHYPPNKELPNKAIPDSLRKHSHKCNCGRCSN